MGLSGLSRLLVISHTPHYLDASGAVVGFGPTLDELSHLAALVDELVHIAPLYSGPPPPDALPYSAENIRYVSVKPAGGTSLMAKVGVLWQWMEYWRVIDRELRTADAVHVRAPANIALLAMIQLMLRKHPRMRWFKYAGNWLLEGQQALSYRIQRWILHKRWPGGYVTRNGQSPDDPPHVIPFYNPSFSEALLERAAEAARRKTLAPPVRFIYVGRVEAEKGIWVALDVLAQCREKGLDVHLDVVGGGPLMEALPSEIARRNLQERVRVWGALPRPEVFRRYLEAHFILLPTRSEGWPKVLSEAMGHGVVPLANAVSSIPQNLQSFGTGKAVPGNRTEEYVKAVISYTQDPKQWEIERDRALAAARRFTYEAYLTAVRALFERAMAENY